LTWLCTNINPGPHDVLGLYQGRPEADLKGGSGLGGRSPPREKGDDAGDDEDDGADAPRPNPPQLGPQAHPVQEKISRSGEPLTLIILLHSLIICQWVCSKFLILEAI